MKEEIRRRLTIHDEKYLDLYIEICSCDDESGYTEAHHILPRSIWPEKADFNKCSENMVKLSYINHVLAHYYFSKATGMLWNAVIIMIYPSGFRDANLSNLCEDDIISLAHIRQEMKENYRFIDTLSEDQLADWKRKVSKGVKNMWDTMSVDEKKRRALKSATTLKSRGFKRTLESREKQSISMIKSLKERSPEKTKMALENKKLSHRKGEHWKYYSEAFTLWNKHNRPTSYIFKNIARDNGLPWTRYGYDTMVKQFKEDLKNGGND